MVSSVTLLENGFLESLKIIYSYNKFKIAMKRMRGSFMNNRSYKYKIMDYTFPHLLSYTFLLHTLLCEVLCYTTEDTNKCTESSGV